MATGRKVPAKRAARTATGASAAAKRVPASKVAAKRAAGPAEGANGAAHKPLARGAAKPARADAAERRELAVDAADSGARRARAAEAAVPVQLADADVVVRPPYWDKACADLVKRDRILKKLIPKFGPAHLVKRGDPFVTLARSVVGQQISVATAQAVWAAIEAACPKLTPQQVIRLGQEKLAACGLSKRKSDYILDLAQHFVSGALHVDKWTSMEDEAVIAELTQIRGIGRWTAEMFLIFNLSRPDVLPLDDLGLIRAISINYFSGEPVTRSEAREVAANWEPWRTVATWYMWRSLDPESGDA
ncbi:DNA-3-methyladenine glycosylase family protein [Burkholderia glumae]|uniref:DNA-3-methyladenine glycosylase II n=3 Tax=Burkholderia glumae TaxID=337 RepID=A0AAP9Y3A3_BURGL|nr:DNA-3-methyladenine glycosylase [Burkholderia glumae]ACR29446.1 DNA-3-methyladenine glycosylase [Burkholderia glumae BGR1]AJY65673.1 hhH-GPD superbase excision DNA repair family protein [Burkholderia glumae LMG 2196 = ATCC 33617]KHJ63579.1 DNA-3-methyladenine glycosylase [Burkholderia glumae]MCM2482843.1 DNA-3-methyladenine glycosylase 2 family protein [Burkholderia glumae]MCM2492747.1 DNA-3-methyladenine glycosylase 2 family protein [Burkholderia glumae]